MITKSKIFRTRSIGFFQGDDYDVHSDAGVLASADADNMNVFSIPVGVTLSKDIVAGAWTVKPVLDLTVSANAGDDEFDSDVKFSGMKNAASLSTEVLDDFTYGGALGVQAKYGESLSFGVNVNYVGSDNADEFGVMGDVRFMF